MVTIFTNLLKNLEESQNNFNEIYDQRMLILKEKLDRLNTEITNANNDDS